MPASALPTLYLLPGLDGSGTFFAALCQALFENANTEILTYPSEGPQTYEALANALAPRLTASDYVLVGESFGGPLAIMLAHQAKTPPHALILAGSFVSNPLPLPGFIILPLLNAVLKSKPVPVLESALLRSGDHQLAWDVFQAISKLKPEVLSDRLKTVLSCNVRTDLAALDIPMLYIQGRQDKLVSAAHGLMMRKIAKNLTIAEVDTPHFVLQYDVDTTVRDVILPFIRDLS